MTRMLFALSLVFLMALWENTGYAARALGDGDHTPEYYARIVRQSFKRGEWEAGRRLLNEGLKDYPATSSLNELAGAYFYHKHEYDDARYHLILALRDNAGNVEAKQLLVNVEEETKNYSSAICYINELLEVNPYWKGLWRRKINLYRKQGNDVEADCLLKRLCTIYPNDEQLRRDYSERLEQTFRTEKKKGNIDASVTALQELVSRNPKNEEYYLSLSNLLLQQGKRSEAADVADRGVSHLPQSTALAEKKAGILADDGRYAEALTFVEGCMKHNHNQRLSAFYKNLMADAARAGAKNDPYVLYGKVYEQSKSQEALDYLLATSISRGYYEDALFYISEARKRQGDTVALLYKAYIVNKRMGNEQEANRLLVRLYERNPHDADVADAVARLRFDQAGRMMADGSWAEALPLLQFAANHAADKELKESAALRIFNCNLELRRYGEAETALEQFHAQFPQHAGYIEKRADLLRRRGRISEALGFLREQALASTDDVERYQCVRAYEEMAVPYIKELLAAGALKKAEEACRELLSIRPSSEQGLRYAINTAARLNHWNDFDHYVKQGREMYPDDLFYVIKQASVFQRQKQNKNAVELLRPWLDEFSGDTLLANAFCGSSADRAAELIKQHAPDSALAVADSALAFYHDNRLLLYTKGLAYEAMHQYDSAYVYQKYYQPGWAEYPDFKRHLESLQAHGFRNGLNLEYLQGRFGEQDILTSIASLEYSRKVNARNAWAGRVNYAGRDGAVIGVDADEQTSGGTGIQVQGEWTHDFNDRWQATGSVAWANKYFPQWMVAGRLQRTFRNDWEAELHASYRRINAYQKCFRYDENTYNEDLGTNGVWTFDGWQHGYQNLLMVGVGTSKTLGDFWMNGKLDAFMLSSKFYLNLSLQGKYYPLNDGKTCIMALASVGSAPEVTMIDYAMPGTFNHLNTMVGLGGQYKIHRNITLGLTGTWYTYYMQQNNRRTLNAAGDYLDYVSMRYKNLFNIDGQVLISF